MPPAEFAANTVSLDPVRARAAVAAIAARSGGKRPPLTEDEVLDTLADRYGMTRTAEILRPVRWTSRLRRTAAFGDVRNESDILPRVVGGNLDGAIADISHGQPSSWPWS